MNQNGLTLNTSQLIDEFNYTYLSNSNKLKNVRDNVNNPLSILGDFKTSVNHPMNTDKTGATTQAERDLIIDYDYDANGNLTLDHNKDISSITYNYLNLPSEITVSNKGTITYIYDAAGNKLQKTTVDNTVSPSKTTTTDYVGGVIYENNELQFFSHEEGRIRPVRDDNNNITDFVYDYMIKDHLGNIRMVLTEELQQNIYPAVTLEGSLEIDGSPNAAFIENGYYTINPDNIKSKSEAIGIPNYKNKNGGTNALDPPVNNNPNSVVTSNSEKLYLLEATSSGGVTGLGITLKVMSGDRIDIYGKSYYFKNNTNEVNYSIPVLDIMGGLLGTPTGVTASKGVSPGQLNGIPGISSVIQNFLSDPERNQGGTATKPRAYINWILFDDNFKVVKSNFDRVGEANEIKSHELFNVDVNRNGFLYVYVNNESPVKVFFDNLQVIHTRGPILEETHYYPFGLTMAGISSKSAGGIENKRKWNAGSELNTDFDINLYETFYRSLDPQIGRFWQIDPKPNLDMSPYSAMGNNPILLNDPLGDTTRVMIGDEYYNLQRNKDGGLSYYNNAGKLYDGKLDDFSQSVLTAANSIAGIKDDEVQSRLTEVLTGEKMITVAEGLHNFDKETGTLSWFDVKNGINTTNGGNIEKSGAISKHKRDSDLELVHEWLGHGFQYSKGMLNKERMLPFYEKGSLIGFAQKVEADASSIVTRAAEASGRPQQGQPIYVEQLKYPNGNPAQLLYHVIPRGYLLTNSESQKPSNYRR